MRKHLAALALAACAFSFGGSVSAARQATQTPLATDKAGDARASAAERVVGDVTNIDPNSKRLSVKTATGQVVSVSTDDKTLYRRIPPGETNVEKATAITFADVSVGDRVLARGKLDADTMQARILLVVSKTELAQSEQQSRAEWQRRGISGTIVGLIPETREILVAVRSSAAAAPLRLSAAGVDVRFKRYAPGSARYADAKASSFEELKMGDRIRALVNRSPDGETLKPEEIIAGSFRIAGGTITSVNASTGEIKIKDLQTRQPVTIFVSKDSMLRRLPAELLARMERSMEQGPMTPEMMAASGVQEVRVMTPQGPGVRRIRTPEQQTSSNQQTPANGSAAPAAREERVMTPRGPGIRRMRIPEGAQPGATPVSASASTSSSSRESDFQDAIEKLPPITIADLKPGDGIIVSSTNDGDASRPTVIMLAAGVESFLKRKEEARTARPGYDLDLALPGLGAP